MWRAGGAAVHTVPSTAPRAASPATPRPGRGSARAAPRRRHVPRPHPARSVRVRRVPDLPSSAATSAITIRAIPAAAATAIPAAAATAGPALLGEVDPQRPADELLAVEV